MAFTCEAKTSVLQPTTETVLDLSRTAIVNFLSKTNYRLVPGSINVTPINQIGNGISSKPPTMYRFLIEFSVRNTGAEEFSAHIYSLIKRDDYSRAVLAVVEPTATRAIETLDDLHLH